MSDSLRSPAQVRALSELLFAGGEESVFAVLDGASVPELLERLSEWRPRHFCLYRGELAPDLARAAPYLVGLDFGGGFTEWVLREGLGKHWGIFGVSDADLAALRRHFRRFLMVYDPDGKPLYFRYYDPRVLRVYLPTCSADEARSVFGPIRCLYAEADDDASLLRFSPTDAAPRREALRMPG